jgi:hypothetical protein
VKTKGELIALVAALRSCRLRFREIALLLKLTPARIGQIVVAYRIDPPKFRTRETALIWLTAHYPDLARALEQHLKK